MTYSGGIRRVPLMVLMVFLAWPEGTWKVEGISLGSGSGRGEIQIQEQELNPSPFKAFLQQQEVKERQESENRLNGQLQPRFSASSPEWETVLDPKLYIITEYEDSLIANHSPKPNEVMSESDSSGEESPFSRLRRNNGANNGHSLSIVNPLDVLRQRLLLEIARRRNLKQNQHQIIANAEILKNIG